MNRREAIGLTAASIAAGPVLGAESRAGSRTHWKPLFNGQNVADWDFFQEDVGSVDRERAINVHGGVIHVLGPRFTGGTRHGFGYLATRQPYGNYHLRAEYKWGDRRFEPRVLAKRNSGILYHMAADREIVWPDSIEFQIQESDVADAILISTRALHGASLGGTPAWPEHAGFASKEYVPALVDGGYARQWFRKDGNFEKLDDWNTLELIAVGDKAAHLVNGRVVTTLFNIQARDRHNQSEFVPLREGRIALEIEGAEIMFREIAIRALA